MPELLREISINPGRVRLKCPLLKRNSLLTNLLELSLNNMPGIIKCQANPHSTSIIILYNNKVISLPLIKQQLSYLLYLPQEDIKEKLKSYSQCWQIKKEKERAKKYLIIFLSAYFLMILKQRAAGKNPLSKSSTALILVSVIVIISGYPISKKTTTNQAINKSNLSLDTLLKAFALFLTIARESNEGVLVLALKSFNDYIKANADLKSHRQISQSIKSSTELKKINTKYLDGELLPPESTMYNRIVSFRKKIYYVSFGLAGISLLFTRSIYNPLSILLVFCPEGANVAMSSGLQQYNHLLQKNKIYLQNPGLLERVLKAEYIVIDKNAGYFSQNDINEVITALEKNGKKLILITEDIDSDRKLELINRIKDKGVVMMVGDGEKDLAAMKSADVSVSFIESSHDIIKLHSDIVFFEHRLHKLEDIFQISQQTYRLVNQSIFISKLYNIGLGSLAFFHYFNPFTAKTISTVNSLIVLLSNQLISNIKVK